MTMNTQMPLDTHTQREPAPPDTLFRRRYRIVRLLGRGGMGAVFLAEDRLDGKLVALKCVLPSDRRPEEGTNAAGSPLLPQEAALVATVPPPMTEAAAGVDFLLSPIFAGPQLADSKSQHGSSGLEGLELRLALTREFSTLASLRHPYIVSVFDYGFAKGSPFFAMEYLPESRDLYQAARVGSLTDKVILLAQIAQSLAYLHRRGILHRDLKPGNVLIIDAAADRQVKVLDFGLALPRDLAAGTAAISGTLAYMAPELFTGSPPSEASDLYALGVIAFEMLSGGLHPQALTEGVGDEERIDTSLLDAPEALRELVSRLLCRDASERPSDAAALSRELYRGAGLVPPAEQLSIRESYLQAARFVSRQTELQTLLAALRNALKGKGGMILIGGESGVGKSRLLDEVRTQALVHGAQVLRGQAVREGGAPFQVLRDVVEPLSLSEPIDDQALAVLAPLFPRLAQLLNRPVADAPALDAPSMQERTLGTLEQLFESASSDPQHTLVIILEDLHWAGRESLSLLARLGRFIGHSALLILGTYRDDEAKDLPLSIPDGEVLKLRRLDSESIASLGESMLGTAGRNAHLVEFLSQESEGNPFFIVEILRALAHESGQLDTIAQHGLPPSILTGGVRALLGRRLQQVPAWASPLLELAAVVGRQLEPDILAHGEARAALDGRSLGTWLQYCADWSLIEVCDQRWRFAHDKLRECVLEQLRGAARLKEVHAQAAQAIERAYPDDPSDEHALPLAHHLLEAIPLVSAAHAISVALRAAKREMQQLGFDGAASLLDRTVALRDFEAMDVLTRYEVFLTLGLAHIRSGSHKRGKEACEQAAQIARNLQDAQRLAQAALTHGSELGEAQHDHRLIALLEEALEALPPGSAPLRARAMARLAAALQPSADPTHPVAMAREALAMARQHADPDLLRDVLLSTCAALAGFAHPAERKLLDEEHVALAQQSFDRVQAYRGYLRLIFDCLETGDVAEADRHTAAVAALAKRLRQAQYQWKVPLLGAMRAIMVGQFAQAKELHQTATELAPKAQAFTQLTLMLHSWCRQRIAEQPLEALASATQIRANVARLPQFFQSAGAVMAANTYAQLGDRSQTRAALNLFISQPRHTNFLFNFLCLLAEPCLLLGETALAADLYPVLLPNAQYFRCDVNCMLVDPPVSQPLGLLAMTMGRMDDAVCHLEDALARSEASGLVSCLARLRYHLAQALRHRGAAGDVARAASLLAAAHALATGLNQRALLPLLEA